MMTLDASQGDSYMLHVGTTGSKIETMEVEMSTTETRVTNASLTFVTKKDAATMLGVSKSTIERLEYEGTFPKGFLITPKRRVYRLTDVEQYIADRMAA